MISPTAADSGPFTLVANTHDGHTRRFDTLEDATAYAGRLLNLCNVTSEIFGKHGQMVGSTETITDGCPFEDGPAAA